MATRPPTTQGGVRASSSPSDGARMGSAGPSAPASGGQANSGASGSSAASAASSSNASDSFGFLSSSGGYAGSGGAYPGLLAQMRAPAFTDAKAMRARAKALATGQWQRILEHVIESTHAAASGGGGGSSVPARRGAGAGAAAPTGGSLASVLDGARRGLLGGGLPGGPLGSPDLGEEVYGLGGGYSPLVRGGERMQARGRGHLAGGATVSAAAAARAGREPDTEAWQTWQSEDWQWWREHRVRERERNSKMAAAAAAGFGPGGMGGGGFAGLLGGRSSASGERPHSPSDSDPLAPSSGVGAVSASSKAKRDLELHLSVELNPLDHIHTVRSASLGGATSASAAAHGHGAGTTSAHYGHGKKAAAARAHVAQMKAHDAKFQRQQKEHATQLYRQIFNQQLRQLSSGRALQHWGDKWDRKLDGYRLTLERDAQGNRIHAWHQMDEAERAAVVAAQNGLGGGFALDALQAHTVAGGMHAAMMAQGGHVSGGGGVATEGHEGEEDSSGATAAGSGSSNAPGFGGGSSGGGEDGEPGSGALGSFPSQIRKLQASNPHKHVYHGSLSARNFTGRGSASFHLAELAASGGAAGAGASHTGSLSARAQVSDAAAHASTFEAMLSSGLAAQQQQQQQQAAQGGGGGGGRNRSTLFHRAIQSLKNRKALLGFDEREQSELKEIHDVLARDGASGSKLAKAQFKNVIVANFAAVGGMAAPIGGGAGSDGVPTPSSATLLAHRTRIEPLLDRIWLACNSTGRNAPALDLPDFQQLLGLALLGSLEDRAAFAFAVYDLDDDGLLDVHDLFLALHLGLDEYFPRDFHLLSAALHEKMELHAHILARRQQRMVDNADRERRNNEWGKEKKRREKMQQQLQQQQQEQQDQNRDSQEELSASSASAPGSGSSSRPTLQLPPPSTSSQAHDEHDDVSSFSGSPPTTAAPSPYVHQELPALHLTKQEFIRLFTNAAAYAAAAAAAPSGHASAYPHAQQDSHHSSGASTFRAAQLALQSGSVHLTGGAGAGIGSSLSGAGSVDLVDMLLRSFLYPYRKAGSRLGAPSASQQQPTLAAREREKERQMALAAQQQGGFKLQQQQQQQHASAEEKSNLLMNSSTKVGSALVHSARVAREQQHRRSSAHGMEELKTHSRAAQQQQQHPQKQQPGHSSHKSHASYSSSSCDASALHVVAAAAPAAAAAPPPAAVPLSDVDQLLLNIRNSGASSNLSGGGGGSGGGSGSSSSIGAMSSGGGRLSKSVFRKLLVTYLSQSGPAHRSEADQVEEERVADFLFFAMDTAHAGTLDAAYVGSMLAFVLKEDAASQMRFLHLLFDLDRDGVLSARDLCMAHDLTNSHTLRTDLNVLLEVFSKKIQHVIVHTRTGGSGNGMMASGGSTMVGDAQWKLAKPSPRDVVPEPPQQPPQQQQQEAPGGSMKRTSSATAGGKKGAHRPQNSDPAVALERSPVLDAHTQAMARAGAFTGVGGHVVGLTLEELSEALFRLNPSLTLKLLRRMPYQRPHKSFQAASLRGHHQHGHGGHGHGHGHGGHGGHGHGGHHHGHGKAHGGAGGGGGGNASGKGGADAAHGGAHSDGLESGFEELHHLQRSLLRELRVQTQQDFSSKFPDEHNCVIGEQIATYRRSRDFQHDCIFHTRVFYLAHQFLKPQVAAVAAASPTAAGGAAVVSLPTTAASLDYAYTQLLRLLTRVPQLYVQTSVVLQDGSKYNSAETAKFRNASRPYSLVTKQERRKARYKMVATPGVCYAFGGFPRPKNADPESGAELTHYGQPVRCILLSVAGAQLNEQDLDDVDFLRRDAATGERYLDQPLYLLELVAQVHLWLSGFADMVELENNRAGAGGQQHAHAATSGGGRSSAAAAAAAASAASSSSSSPPAPRTGLLRVVRIGAGNFAAVPGMEHQGALIAYLLLHAFLINLKRNSVTHTPAPQTTQTQAVMTPKPPQGAPAHMRHRTNASMGSAGGAAAMAAAAAASASAAPPPPAAPPAPVTTSLYRHLGVLEFVYFDESLCPPSSSLLPSVVDPLTGNVKRMLGGVEVRFTKRDVLDLTPTQTHAHHVGLLVPADSFALAGNEEGYTSLSSMLGNNTSLRLHQAYHFNAHLLHQANYTPVELPATLVATDPTSAAAAAANAAAAAAEGTSAAAPVADLWQDMQLVLASELSPSPWEVPPELTTTLGAAHGDDGEGLDSALEHDAPLPQVAEDEDDFHTLRTDE